MSWYQRTKLVFHSLRRNENSNILSTSHHVSYSIKLIGSSKFSSTSSRELGLRSHVSNNINPTGSSTLSWFSSIFSRQLGLLSHVPYSINPAGSSKFSCFSSISSRILGLRSLGQKTNRIVYNPFSYSSNRFYYADRNQVRDFKPRGPRWFHNSQKTILYFGNLETVPYTNRTRLIFLPKCLEKLHGETQFENFKEKEKEKILPENHPKSIRVQMITKKVVDALQRGVRSDSQVHASSSHLEGINWEVLVVKEPRVNAFCMPAGKIVVNTGLLDKFKSDVEVATVIGHEVGHVVARHYAESMTKNSWFAIPKLVLYKLYMPHVVCLIVSIISSVFLKLPSSRKMEKEADYIGLILLASAGYDPREAPKMYEKLGGERNNSLEEFLSTHPSGEKRSQLLAQASVMEEALKIYREVQSRQERERNGLHRFAIACISRIRSTLLKCMRSSVEK